MFPDLGDSIINIDETIVNADRYIIIFITFNVIIHMAYEVIRT